MSLNEKIQKITKVGKNGAVVEFSNGFGIAYETRPKTIERTIIDDDGFVKDSQRVDANTLSYRVLGPSLSCGINRSLGPDREGGFSQAFEKILQKPMTANQRKHAELEKTIKSCYDSMVEPLQIERYAHRQWKEYASNIAAFAGLTAIWPIAVPAMMVSSYFRTPSHAGNTLGMALLLAPLALPQAIYHSMADIINPQKKAYRVQNKKALRREAGDDCAALIFKYNECSTPRSFNCHTIVLPNGMSLTEGKKRARKGNTSYTVEGREIYAHREKFNDFEKAKWFFKIDQDVKAQVYRAIEERDALVDSCREFEHKLSKEDHYAVLKTSGLLGAK